MLQERAIPALGRSAMRHCNIYCMLELMLRLSQDEVWNGVGMTPEAAVDVFGADEALPLSEVSTCVTIFTAETSIWSLYLMAMRPPYLCSLEAASSIRDISAVAPTCLPTHRHDGDSTQAPVQALTECFTSIAAGVPFGPVGKRGRCHLHRPRR